MKLCAEFGTIGTGTQNRQGAKRIPTHMHRAYQTVVLETFTGEVCTQAAGWVLQLAAASAGAGPVVFSALSRALRVQSMLLLLVSHIRGAIGWLHLLGRTSCSLVGQIVGS